MKCAWILFIFEVLINSEDGIDKRGIGVKGVVLDGGG